VWDFNEAKQSHLGLGFFHEKRLSKIQPSMGSTKLSVGFKIFQAACCMNYSSGVFYDTFQIYDIHAEFGLFI
jgi:hypothetical protein